MAAEQPDKTDLLNLGQVSAHVGLALRQKDIVSLGVPVQYIQGGCFIHKSLLPRVLFLLASRLLAAHDAYIKEAA